MKKIITAALSFIALFGLATAPVPVLAQTAGDIKDGVDAISGDEEVPELGDQIRIVVNILLFLLGAVAVIMIVIGGIRYTTANGDQSALTGAKNTILYAVVGLIVALLAYAIVNFVIDAFV